MGDRAQLRLGPLNLWSPLLLAPMAGVTDLPFRRLCRQFGERPLLDAPGWQAQLATARRGVDAPSGLYVMEMITARALVEGNRETWRMIQPDDQERVRSVQLYGTNPHVMAAATKLLVEGDYVDHIDMNFGCPVPKVTRRGGGAALPWKRDLYEQIVAGVVETADRHAKDGPGSIPVTVKMRLGIDDDHLTAFDAGKIAENVGAVGVGIHARTQEQYYSGSARWPMISKLKEHLKIPVFGNGDIFSGTDATDMIAETGCDAVIVGRGCQGRPWIFGKIIAEMHGLPEPDDPNLGEVAQIILQHAELMVETTDNEDRAMREMRKHIGWYLRGFPVGGRTRQQLSMVSTLEELGNQLSQLEPDVPFPPVAEGRRGRAGTARTPHLPHGWLDSRSVTESEAAELDLADGDGGSGG